MAGAWEQLINQFTNQNRTPNPGVEALGQLLANATKMKMGERQMAQQAVFSRYPSIAASRSGIPGATEAAASTGGVPQGMDNMRLEGINVDETGVPSYKFGTTQLADKDILSSYNQYLTEIQKSNQMVEQTARVMGTEYSPIKIPTFEEYKSELFNSAQGVAAAEQPDWVQTLTEDELTFIQSSGFTLDDVIYTAQQEGLDKESILNLIRSAAQE